MKKATIFIADNEKDILTTWGEVWFRPVLWEYKVISEPPNGGPHLLQAHLEQLGADCWELAGILGLIFIFKRPKQMVVT